MKRSKFSETQIVAILKEGDRSLQYRHHRPIRKRINENEDAQKQLKDKDCS
jgi:hypothetical protein